MYITPFVLNYHLSDIKNITNIYQNVNYASHVNFTRFILDSEASQKYKQYTKKKHTPKDIEQIPVVNILPSLFLSYLLEFLLLSIVKEKLQKYHTTIYSR